MSDGVSSSVHGRRKLVGSCLKVNPRWRDIGHADALQPGGQTLCLCAVPIPRDGAFAPPRDEARLRAATSDPHV